MNTPKWGDRFERDLEILLAAGEISDMEKLPGEYRRDLEAALALFRVDFSHESRIRESLHRCLLNRTGFSEPVYRPDHIVLKTKNVRRLGSLVVSLAGLCLLVIVSLAGFGALTPAAQNIEAWIQSLVLGSHTTIQQFSSSRATSTPTLLPTSSGTVEVQLQGNFWVIRTAIGSFASPANLPGRPSAPNRSRDVDKIQQELPFTIRQPAYLPAGYSFREAMATPHYRAFLFYEGPRGDLILLQMPVGEQPGGDPEHPFYAVVEMLTDEPIDTITLSGQPAAWVENRALMWEDDGMNFILGGPDLDREEALRVAVSLE